MSLVTTARLMRGQSWRVSWSTSAVLPEPTGPAMPTRYALAESVGSIALASCGPFVVRRSMCHATAAKYCGEVCDRRGERQAISARANNSAGRFAGLAHVFVFERQRADF